MKIAYLSSEYISHAIAALGNRRALADLGVTLVDDPKLADVVVLHDEPPNYPAYLKAHPVLRERYVIAYAVWETTILPQVYVEALDGIDEIWTASRFTQALFSSVHPRVFRVPHLVNKPEVDEQAIERMRARVNWKDDVFYFFTIADAGNPRKNLGATLRAFEQLRQTHKACLIVKQYARIDESLSEHPGVISISEPLHAADIDALHQIADAYVSSHCAEAWGLGMSEAMAAGTPVIATAYSGNLDYMTPQSAHLVNYTLESLRAEDIAFAPALWSKEMQWAVIDESELATEMANCVQSRGHDTKQIATQLIADFGIRSLRACLTARIQAWPKPSAVEPTARRQDPESIGLFHQHSASDGVIVGRSVAVEQMLLAFAQSGSRSYSLYVPRQDTPTLRQRYAKHERVSVWEHEALQAHPKLAAWHEPQFLTHEPFARRTQAGGTYPITLVHHTLSYRELLHDKFLPLLLSLPRSYDSLVCSSNAAREACLRLLNQTAERFNASYDASLCYDGRLDVIPLPVDTERFQPRDRHAARNAFEVPDDAFVLLWVGRLSAVDKADLLPLLQVLSRLRTANPNKKLMLVCAGRQRAGERFGDALQDYATQLGLSESLRVIDDLEGGLEELYAVADVFVSPSDNLQESYGITPIEAMACGIPQVVSDWNGYRDSVIEGETGFLIPSYWARCHDRLNDSLNDSVRDHLEMAQAVVLDLPVMQARLQDLIEQPSLREAMGKASRQRALEHYAFAPVVARYEALWSELAAMSASTPSVATTPSYRETAYTTTFSHYPSQFIENDVVLRLSENGLAVTRGQQGLPLYYNPRWGLFEESLLRRIMEGAAKMHEKDLGISLERIVKVLSKGRSDDELQQHIIRHTMWLLKQGFLEFDSPPR